MLTALRLRQFVEDVGGSCGGRGKVLRTLYGWPVRLDGRPTRVTSSPVLGKHMEQMQSDWLGLSGAAVAALKADGAL